MQAFKVKLNKNHTAETNQITKDGYLADDDGKPFIYNQSAAKDKAKLFGGTPEKFGKNYVITTCKFIQLDKKILNPLTVEYLKERIAYTYKKDETLTLSQDMFICYGNVFDEILELGGLPAEIIDELKALSVFCVEVDYVHFL